jgi:hypothetical protein
MGMRLPLTVAATVILAACNGAQQSTSPTISTALPVAAKAAGRSTGHLMLVGGLRPDKGCPKEYIYCVTLSAGKSVQLYFCYSPGSYCGPSQYQYTWVGDFYTANGNNSVTYFNGVFSPNPGDPTYDTISEVQTVKSSHGRIKYEQLLCAYPTCDGLYHVGIRTK